MNMFSFKILNLLILCITFSSQSFSHWGDWGDPTAQGSLVYCIHNSDKGSKHPSTKAELNTQGPLSKINNLELRMRITSGSKKSIMKPQIIKSSDRIKKAKPHFPIEQVRIKKDYIEKIKISGDRKPNSSQIDVMGYQPNEPGLIWSCRITDDL